MTEDEYKAALNRMWELCDAEPGTTEGAELDRLCDEVEAYEDAEFWSDVRERGRPRGCSRTGKKGCSMMDELSALIAVIRNAKNNGRHDGLGEPVIGVDLYQTAALKACDEIERMAKRNTELEAKIRTPAGSHIIDVDSELFVGLALNCLPQSILANTIHELKSQRDSARAASAAGVTDTRVCAECGFRWHDGPEECPLCQSRELNALFDLQWTRTVEADAAYVAAHPKPGWPHGYKPDLGRLVGWLMEEAGLKERSE